MLRVQTVKLTGPGFRRKKEGKKLQGKNIMAPLLRRAAITITQKAKSNTDIL